MMTAAERRSASRKLERSVKKMGAAIVEIEDIMGHGDVLLLVDLATYVSEHMAGMPVGKSMLQMYKRRLEGADRTDARDRS